MNNEMMIPFDFTIENPGGEPVMIYSAFAFVELERTAPEFEWSISGYFIHTGSENGSNVYEHIEDETVIKFLATNEDRFIDQVGARVHERLETAA